MTELDALLGVIEVLNYLGGLLFGVIYALGLVAGCVAGAVLLWSCKSSV